MTKEEQEVFDWLEYFYMNADFGPAHDDVVNFIKEDYEKETGKQIPKDW